MKIRTQFYLLIAGVILVPLFVMVVSYFGFRLLLSAPSTHVPAYEEVAAMTGVKIGRDEWEHLAEFIAHHPSTMDFIVSDSEGLVLFSTLDRFPAGGHLDGNEFQEYLRESSDRYLFQIDSPPIGKTRNLLVITRIELRPSSPLTPPPSIIMAILGLLIAFSVTMSAVIAGSITRSVTQLESATRRIAAGELDTTVRAKGSNEITSLTESLNRMRLALKDEAARRARFIMGVTHDLKTPLALIKGYAEAIGDGMADDTESRARFVGIIGAKADQLEGMIDDLIDFVRMDTGEWRKKLERVDVARFIRSYALRSRADAEMLGRRVEFSVDIPEGLTAPMDERLAQRALENLVNNALRYTDKGGTVCISARLERSAHASSAGKPDTIAIEIADDGPGIEERDLPYIFDAFYRGSSSRREQGMGLGLSVVKGIADSHNWELTVSSKRGEGSIFRILLPIES